jgi:hypothetical protein
MSGARHVIAAVAAHRAIRRVTISMCALLTALAALAGTAPTRAAAQVAFVDLTASSSTGGTNNPVTLVATSNVDVTPTPYYIDIYDITSGRLLNSCGYANSCSATDTVPGCVTHSYRAYIADPSTTPPPTNIQATSNTVSVEWWALSLSATPAGQAVGGAVQLNAGTCRDVLPTPYFIQIYKGLTNMEMASCGGGTSCTVSDTEVLPICITFQAAIAPSSQTYPAPGAVATASAQACWGLAGASNAGQPSGAAPGGVASPMARK